MRTAKASHPTRRARTARHIENTTDATRGEPLAARAKQRRAELEKLLDMMPDDEARGRNDIELALSEITELMTGDVEHLSRKTSEEISRWLESSKHLAESAPKWRRSHH